jgi:Uma2 family endonuclease
MAGAGPRMAEAEELKREHFRAITLVAMAHPSDNPDQRFTWADYRTWPDDERWEIIDGHAYQMAAAPRTRHQHVAAELTRQLGNHLHGKPCHVFTAPTDLKLSEEDVVQPDILVVCDKAQIKPTHIEGPPTLVIEILSPSSYTHDRIRKTQLYARAGVKELWLVAAYPPLIEIFLLDGTSYRYVAGFGKDDIFASPTFPELELSLADLFDFPIEPGDEPPQVVREPAAAYANRSD